MPVTVVVHTSPPREGREGGPSSEGASAAAAVNEPISSLCFDAPRIVLGRSEACDVRLPDPSVSGRHASIRARDAGYVVVDEGSTNGSRLNGEKLSAQAPRSLKSGDQLTLGRVTVTIRLGAARPSPPQATRELALALVARALGDAGAQRPTLEVIEGPDVGSKLELAAGARTIGRDPRCTMRLTDRGVPPIAVDVALEGTRTKITRRDERCEVLLGERSLPVGEVTAWLDLVVMTIASTKVRLDDPVARALDRSALGDDEKVAAAVAPDPSTAGAHQAAAGANANVDPDDASSLTSAASAAEARSTEAARGDASVRVPRIDRRRSWRGATVAFELVALILGLLVLGLSAAGFYWLLRK